MNGYNLGQVTQDAFNALNDLDKTFIGTPNYLGMAFFWSYEYRHFLRDANLGQRKKVHAAFLKAGLDPVEHSDKHLNIIKAIIK